MGDLILFRSHGGPIRKNKVLSASGAEIVFFTGVRYARMPEATAAPEAADNIGAPPSGGMGGASRRKRRRGA